MGVGADRFDDNAETLNQLSYQQVCSYSEPFQQGVRVLREVCHDGVEFSLSTRS